MHNRLVRTEGESMTEVLGDVKVGEVGGGLGL